MTGSARAFNRTSLAAEVALLASAANYLMYRQCLRGRGVRSSHVGLRARRPCSSCLPACLLPALGPHAVLTRRLSLPAQHLHAASEEPGHVKLAKPDFRRAAPTPCRSPKWVPQLADAADVLARVRQRPGTRYTVLTPNMKASEQAELAGCRDSHVCAHAPSRTFALCRTLHQEQSHPVWKPVRSSNMPAQLAKPLRLCLPSSCLAHHTCATCWPTGIRERAGGGRPRGGYLHSRLRGLQPQEPQLQVRGAPS